MLHLLIFITIVDVLSSSDLLLSVSSDSTFVIIKAIRAELLLNHSKISKMHDVNIQVFTSAGTPGVQPVVFFFIKTTILDI